MTDELKAELKAAGYTEAEIAKEERYLERVAREKELIRNDRGWDFGLGLVIFTD